MVSRKDLNGGIEKRRRELRSRRARRCAIEREIACKVPTLRAAVLARELMAALRKGEHRPAASCLRTHGKVATPGAQVLARQYPHEYGRGGPCW